MTKKKKIWIIVGSVGLVLLIGGGIFLGIFLKNMSDYRNDVDAIIIEDINFADLKDGVYKGSYNVGKNFPAHIYVDVKVTVSSGVVTKIEILKFDNGSGATAEEKERLSKLVVDVVMDTQSLKGFSYTTGATNGQKTILKAIELALKSPPLPATGATK